MSSSPVSPADIRAAAGVHEELGPEYSDAVVASFLAKDLMALRAARAAGTARCWAIAGGNGP
jgi:hypothetical protein